jgi:hypothetical protein
MQQALVATSIDERTPRVKDCPHILPERMPALESAHPLIQDIKAAATAAGIRAAKFTFLEDLVIPQISNSLL